MAMTHREFLGNFLAVGTMSLRSYFEACCDAGAASNVGGLSS